jgi:hypothetical protein
MRIQRHDDDDIRELFERGSSAWTGPSPFARQSRWAAVVTAGRDRAVHLGLAAAGATFAIVVFGVTFLAASSSPGSPAGSVMQLVSHVFSGSAGPPGGVQGGPATPAATSSPSPGATVPAAVPVSPSRTTPRAVPTPTRSPQPDDHRASPSPGATPFPSPNPSRPPDE